MRLLSNLTQFVELHYSGSESLIWVIPFSSHFGGHAAISFAVLRHNLNIRPPVIGLPAFNEDYHHQQYSGLSVGWYFLSVSAGSVGVI